MTLKTSLDEIAPIDMMQTVRYNVMLMGRDAAIKEKLAKVLGSVMNRESWKHWTDSSGKADPPPDYYSERFNLMMEVMRIDDHEFVDVKHKVNRQRMMEGKLLKAFRKSPLGQIEAEGMVFINPISDLPSEEDHNYGRYVDCFRRVVGEHIGKIDLYRDNHPGMRLVFLIFDESTAYGELAQGVVKRSFKAGDDIECRPHYWWFDRRMLEVLVGTDIDYVIWFAPYKDNRIKDRLPSLVVFDPKDELFMWDYDKDRMVSLEE